MTKLRLGDLRESGGAVEIECVACGHIEHRAARLIEGPDATAVGAIGLGLACGICGGKACITSPSEKDLPPETED